MPEPCYFFLVGQPNTDKLHLMALKRVGGNVSNTYSLQSTAPTSPERHRKQSQMDSRIDSFHMREDMGYKFTMFIVPCIQEQESIELLSVVSLQISLLKQSNS